jgi:predicted permease
MSWADLKTTLRQYTLYASAAVKLLLIPAVTALALLPLGLDPMLYGVCVLLAATPTAGATSIFAQKFERDTATAAQLVTLSTCCRPFR